jgi:hypothetical protein
MASVFNTTVPDALQATQAAIRGEMEPIRRFGVQLDDATIRAKAVELGLAATTKEVTQQEKGLAALELIYEKTNNTAGDFLNTSDSLANRQKVLAEQFEDTKAKVGEALAPAMEGLLDVAEALLPVLEALGPAVGSAGQALGGLAGPVATAAGFLGTLIEKAQIGAMFMTGIFPPEAEDRLELSVNLMDESADAVENLVDAVLGAPAAHQAAAEARLDEANAIDAAREATRNAALESAKALRDRPKEIKSVDLAADAYDGYAASIRSATSAALEAASPALALNAANERVVAAEEALKTVREDGKSSAEDMASAVADLTGAQLELDAQRANVLGTMGDTETAMRNAATEVGITKEEFDTFWQSLDDRPSSVDFDINFRFHTSGGGLGAPPSISSGVTESRFQHGGDFTAGQPIRVGEAGPELLIPTGSGTVIPNNQLSQNVTVHMEGSGDVYDDMSLALAMSGITEEIEWSGTSTLRG